VEDNDTNEDRRCACTGVLDRRDDALRVEGRICYSAHDLWGFEEGIDGGFWCQRHGRGVSIAGDGMDLDYLFV
jgi:hypothetical protein